MKITLNQYPSRNKQERALLKKVKSVKVRNSVNVSGRTKPEPEFKVELPLGIGL